jgi:hypothetical protein
MHYHQRHISRRDDDERRKEQGTLLGYHQIGAYLGVCAATAGKYKRLHGLPCCRMPDGRMGTTKSLIDQWILARAEAERQAKIAVESGS